MGETVNNDVKLVAGPLSQQQYDASRSPENEPLAVLFHGNAPMGNGNDKGRSSFAQQEYHPYTKSSLLTPSKVDDDAGGGDSDDFDMNDHYDNTSKASETDDGKPLRSVCMGLSTNKDEDNALVVFNQHATHSCSDSLRFILSDPISSVSGALMRDAVILPCGHSFGAAGRDHATKKLASHALCPFPRSPYCLIFVSFRYNFAGRYYIDLLQEFKKMVPPALQVVVQAFCRENELRNFSKRRRDRTDQEKYMKGDPSVLDSPRGRGLQYPFVVADRVVIKGNKRTPLRFVGREAVVTTQCLNGWYVVKLLDSTESVKLQYRSLEKVGGG